MRDVKKLVYSSSGEKDKYKQIKEIVEKSPKTYETIREEWRQENYVIAISVIYFLHRKESQPDFLFPWLLELLQHNNGYIRYATIRMFENEFGPLTVHIRYPGREVPTIISSAKADSILFALYRNLRSLIAQFWKLEYKKYTYVSSLPVGVYKSIQLLLSCLEDLCGEDYLYHLEKKFYLIN